MTKGAPFPIDPVLTGIVVNYQNADLVADRVLPRVAPQLTRKIFKWMKYSFIQQITIPDTRVGRKGEPNMVEFDASEELGETQDYGLDDFIPNDDVTQAPAGYDPRAFAAQNLMNLVLLDREVRVAGRVFNSATYAAANKTLLAGTSQWSHASSDPIADIATAKDGMVMDPNKLLLGRATWSALRRNPKVLSAITVSGTEKGMAKREAVADLLEVDEIIIGSAWVNNAKPGQPAVRARTWGKHALLFRQEKTATAIGQAPTFGYTVEYLGRISGTLPGQKQGLRGGEIVRAGESVGEVISAPDLGYFFENAVA